MPHRLTEPSSLKIRRSLYYKNKIGGVHSHTPSTTKLFLMEFNITF